MIFKNKLMYFGYFILFLLLPGLNREAQATTTIEYAFEMFVSYLSSDNVKKISQTINIPYDKLSEIDKLELTLTKEELEKVCKFSEAMKDRIVKCSEESSPHGVNNCGKNGGAYNAMDYTFNEDRAVDYYKDGVRIIVVADGHSGNEISKQLTDSKEGIAPFLDGLLKKGHDISKPEILSAASISYNEALRKSELFKGGSTCTLLIDRQGENNLIVSSVGDSPCMVFTHQGEILTTKDHNVKNKAEVKRLGSVTDMKYKVEVPTPEWNTKYFNFLIPNEGNKDTGINTCSVNISRTFGDGFKLLPIPDVAQIPREQVSLISLFSDGFKREQIITLATKSEPSKPAEGYNIAFPKKAERPVGLRLRDDSTVVFYNPNIKKE